MSLTPEQQVDHDDWDRFRAIERMADHWWWRPGWSPTRHYLTWFVTYDQPELLDYVARFQAALADLDYLDPVPAQWLHTTVQGIGFADEVTDAQVDAIAATARTRLADLAPIELTVGPINAYEGGTFLRLTPSAPIAEIRRHLRSAIAAVLGADRVPDDTKPLKPHISVTYCHADPPAGEVIDRLTHLRQLPAMTVRIPTVDLLEQRREGRTYQWDTRHHVPLGQP